jgi:hypothetical protein
VGRSLRRGQSERTGAARLRSRGPIPQRAVRTDGVVGPPPTLDQHLGLQQGVEHLSGQELVIGHACLAALRVPSLTQDPACPAFGHHIAAECVSRMLDRLTPLRRAQKLSCARLRQPPEELPCPTPHPPTIASADRSPSRDPSAASPGPSEDHRTHASSGSTSAPSRQASEPPRLPSCLSPTPPRPLEVGQSSVLPHASFLVASIALPWWRPLPDSLSKCGLVEGGQVASNANPSGAFIEIDIDRVARGVSHSDESYRGPSRSGRFLVAPQLLPLWKCRC